MVSNCSDSPPTPRFPLGDIYATSTVIQWAASQGLMLYPWLSRHHHGDWGDLSQEDKNANEDALAHGGRIFSSYLTQDRKIYVITESNCSSTTILFAEEY